LVEEVKRNSSRWIKTLEYVNNQKLHHKQTSFHDEYLSFLKLYHVQYDERYVFTD
jgi:hypothetical protein